MVGHSVDRIEKAWGKIKKVLRHSWQCGGGGVWSMTWLCHNAECHFFQKSFSDVERHSTVYIHASKIHFDSFKIAHVMIFLSRKVYKNKKKVA